MIFNKQSRKTLIKNVKYFENIANTDDAVNMQRKNILIIKLYNNDFKIFKQQFQN